MHAPEPTSGAFTDNQPECMTAKTGRLQDNVPAGENERWGSPVSADVQAVRLSKGAHHIVWLETYCAAIQSTHNPPRHVPAQ